MSTIRLGDQVKPKKPKIVSTPLKEILENKEYRGEINNNLRNLQRAPNEFQTVSVSHDYSRKEHELVKNKLQAAREKYGENAKKLCFQQWPPNTSKYNAARKKIVRPPEIKTND